MPNDKCIKKSMSGLTRAFMGIGGVRPEGLWLLSAVVYVEGRA